MNYVAIPGIKEIHRKGSAPKLTINKILEEVCAYFKVSEERVKSPIRRRNYVYPRHMAMYIMRVHGKVYYREIAELFNRDHTTVIAAMNTVRDMLDTDSNTREDLEQLKVLLYIDNQ